MVASRAREAAILKIALRRLTKVLHTLGAAGFMGGMAAAGAVIAMRAPASAAASDYLPLMSTLADVAGWLIAPSMILAVVSGLLAMLANPAFYDAGWVWLKALTGVLVLEGGLHVLGPLQEEARRALHAPRGAGAPAGTGALLTAEANTLWVLLAVSAANVVLAVWRPRFMRD